MSTRSGILAGGNWVVDKLKVIDIYPQQDALANIISESVGNGGSPFNILVDLVRLQAPFPLAGIGLVGADADGVWIRSQCAAFGIDDSGLKMLPGTQTSYTDVMTVRSTGRRTFFHQRGTNAFLEEDLFHFGSSPAKIFHLGLLLLLDRLDQPDSEFGTGAARVLHRAREAGIKTSIDVASEDGDRFPSVLTPALRYVDFCMLNEFEAERTTGVATRRNGAPDPAGLQRASARLLEAGVRERVFIHFPEGATALGHDGIFHQQDSLHVPQTEIASTVGAGDAFAAGVLYALHQEWSMEDTLRLGVCVAAACLRGVGTSDGIEPLPECLNLATRFGFRSHSKPID